jgi:transcriptional regulator with XRE-family HTH domain
MTAFAHFRVLLLLGMLQARKETTSIVTKTKSKYPNRVPEYRERLGFTQDQLAHMVGWKNNRRIRRIENGEVMPGSLTVFRLSAALRVPVDYLYAETINQLRVEVHAIEERMPKGRQGVLLLPA